MNDDTIDAVSKALRRAWQLGQTYWQQADSDSYKQQDKSDETQKKFEILVDETRALLSASKPAAPVGWKLVPVYPTMEQMDAICLAGDKAVRIYQAAINAAPVAPMQEVKPASPRGWKLVPVEPTREMCLAASKRRVNYPIKDDADSPVVTYRTMLAASPAAPAQLNADTHAAVAFYEANPSAALLDFKKRFAATPAQSGEPVALRHVAVAEDGGKLRWMTGIKPRDCELYAMPDGGRAPKLYAAPQPAQTAQSGAPVALTKSQADALIGTYKDAVLNRRGREAVYPAYVALLNALMAAIQPDVTAKTREPVNGEEGYVCPAGKAQAAEREELRQRGLDDHLRREENGDGFKGSPDLGHVHRFAGSNARFCATCGWDSDLAPWPTYTDKGALEAAIKKAGGLKDD